MSCCGSSAASDVQEVKREKKTPVKPSSNPGQRQNDHNVADHKTQLIFQSRIRDHNVQNPIGENLKNNAEFDGEDVNEDTNDKILTKPNRSAQAFYAEVDGVQWSNLFVDHDPSKFIFKILV